jgi:hypothetical protein
MVTDRFNSTEIAKLEPRRARIVAAKQGGATFREIALTEGCSSELVRQLYWDAARRIMRARNMPRKFLPTTRIEQIASTRLRNVAKRTRLRKIEDLTKYTRDEFSTLRNVGTKTVVEAERILRRAGLKFSVSLNGKQ